jgi:hypothetical protein
MTRAEFDSKVSSARNLLASAEAEMMAILDANDDGETPIGVDADAVERHIGEAFAEVESARGRIAAFERGA